MGNKWWNRYVRGQFANFVGKFAGPCKLCGNVCTLGFGFGLLSNFAGAGNVFTLHNVCGVGNEGGMPV